MTATCIRRALGPTLAILIIPSTAHAQQELRARDHGSRTITKAFELERNEDLAGAEHAFATVLPGDSLYEDALLSHTHVLIQLHREAEALPLCDEGIAREGKQLLNFHINKGVALVQLKRHDEAIAWYDAAIRRFPGNFKLRNLRASALADKGDKAAALAAWKDNVVRFPGQPDAHLALGIVALNEGRTSQATLAFFMCMAVSWGDARAERILGWTDQLLDGKLDHTPEGYDLGMGDDFTELDLLLANKVGMDKHYKAKPDLSYAVVRQGHFLLNNLKQVPKGTGFWTTFYVPFFEGLVARGEVEAFLLHCLDNSTAEKVKANAVKHSKEVNALRAGLYVPFHAMYAEFPDSCGTDVKKAFHLWNNDHDLLAVGEGDMNNDLEVGPWVFHHPNGAVSVRANFDAQHRKSGDWRGYHPNGRLARTNHWEAGEETGVLRAWHPNGAPKDSARLVNGKGDGPYTEWWDTGRLKGRKTFGKPGELTGMGYFFHANDQLDFGIDLKEDVMNGATTAHFPDGRMRFKGAFKEGYRDGSVEFFHSNGNKESVYLYADKAMNGPYTEWFPDGTKKSEGTYLKDHLVGMHRVWYVGGTPSIEESYDDQGRLQGVRKDWTVDGQLYTEMEYTRGLLVRYRYYDRAGKVLAENKRAGGKFAFVGYSPDGNKLQEGRYLDEGAQEGPWKWYWPDGTVAQEQNMKNGKEDGTQKQYYEDGDLHYEYHYVPGKGRTGTWTEHAPGGAVRTEGCLENGDLNGEYRRYWPNGKLAEQGYYVDGERDGWQRYCDPDGVLEMMERYASERAREIVQFGPDGREFNHVVYAPGLQVITIKNPDGGKRAEITYVNMVKNGPATWYYPDGSKATEGAYVEGETQGPWRSWHPNGKLMREWTADLGKMTGTDRAYGIDGVLTAEETYVNGESTGTKRFHPNGKPQIERPKVNGEEHGTTLAWTPEGDLQMIRYFSHGRLIGYSYNGPDGKPVDTIPLPEGVQHLRTFYANGKPSREMDLRNGELDGTYREFYPSGQLMEEARYAVGRNVGISTEYHANGKLATQGDHVGGEDNGEHLANWENGLPKDRCNWAFGQRHGERTLYDRAGKPTLVLTYRNDEVIRMVRP